MKDKIKLILSLFSIAFISMAAMNISPALSKISMAYPDVPLEMVQMLITIPSFCIMLSALCSDYIAKQISVKTTILLGTAIFTLAGSMPMLIDGFWVILVSRVLVGIGLGIMVPLSTAIIFQQFIDIDQRNTMIGWQGCAGAVGNIATTTIAGILAFYGHKIVFSVHLLGLVTFFSVLFLLPKSGTASGSTSVKNIADRRAPHKKLKLTVPTLGWLLLAFVYMTFLHCYSINLSIFVEGSGIGNSAVSGLGLSMLTVGSFSCGLIFGKLARFTKQYTMPIGILLSSLGLLLMALAHDPLFVYISGIITGFGMGMVSPVLVTNSVDSSPPAMTTIVIALNGAMSNLGLSVAPYTVSGVSYIFAGNCIRGRYYVCSAVLFVIAALVFLLTLRRSPSVSGSAPYVSITTKK